MTGGKIRPKGGLAGVPGPGGAMEIERTVHVEDKEKMKAMEEQLEAEKRAMMKDFEKQKQKISAKAELAEEDRQRLLADLEKQNAKQ